MLVSCNPHQATSMLWPTIDRSSICQSDFDDHRPTEQLAAFWHAALSPYRNMSKDEKRAGKPGDSNIKNLFFLLLLPRQP